MAGVRGAEILVVDDSIDVRESTAEILELEGYLVGQAADQDGALRLLEHGHFDVLILDLGLDRVGLGLLDRLEELPVVVAVSSRDDQPEDERIAAFVSKPFAPQLLLRTVAGCLAR